MSDLNITTIRAGVLDRIIYWVSRRRDRKKWRGDRSRRGVYTEIALQAAVAGRAAAAGGYAKDALILSALAEQLIRISNSQDGSGHDD